jgi:signal transduction histidine kinase/FixJ family two-component response regulator
LSTPSKVDLFEGASQAVRDRVLIEQMKMLFEGAAVAAIAATAFAFALAWHIEGVVSNTLLGLWLGAKVLVVLPRIAHGFLFSRRRDDSLSWLRWGRLMLLLDGLVWGAAGIFLTPGQSNADVTVIVATLSGVCAIAAFVLHTEWKSCATFALAMLSPPAITLALRGDQFGVYGGAAMLCFLFLLLLVAHRSERHVVEMLILRFTHDDLTRQLSAARELARQENRAKGEFVANMSHELRTPLHGILGLSRMLLGTMSPGSTYDNIGLIRRCGEHLLGLINNILEFSRFGAQGIDLHPQEVDVAKLIDDTTAMCMPSAVEKGLHLSCELSISRPCVARIDPFRLRQILLNMIGNAVKFTERGSIQVRASEGGNGESLIVRVHDTGVGMSEDVLERIFEPFVQADSSSSRGFGGTGLGLTITRDICRAMGGDIACTSSPGQGSTFSVQLPINRLRARETPGFRATGPSPIDYTERLIGTVLLAEDNDVNAIVAEYSLRRLGVDVERATTGHEVVARVCTALNRPDVVLLDCQMPEMDGFEAARRIRAFEAKHRLARTPLIALTANVFPQDRKQCMDAGMDDFLAKPFSDDQLREAIVGGLANAGHSAEAARATFTFDSQAARIP